MGFWKAVQEIGESCMSREAEQTYLNSERYKMDTEIIENYNKQKDLIERIESTTNREVRSHLIDEFNSIQQESDGENYNLYKNNQKASREDALVAIQREKDFVKAHSMRRLYQNQIYNYADLY